MTFLGHILNHLSLKTNENAVQQALKLIMKLEGNKIIITGATRGIGLAMLDRFYSLNNQIIAVARNEGALIDLASKYENIVTIQCDLSNEKAINQLIEEITLNHKDVNTLINNAGIQVNFYDFKFGEESESLTEIKDEIQINYTAPVELAYRLIPVLINNRNASIINVSSGLAFVPKKSAPVYCGTKAGIHIFSKALRYQYENSNLKIFEIIPPLVQTDMTKGRGKDKLTPNQLVDEFIKAYSKDKFEVNIGKTKLLRFIQRISPRIADNILKNN